MEHHSNIVPWQLLAQDREAELAYVPVLDDGSSTSMRWTSCWRAGRSSSRSSTSRRARNDQPRRRDRPPRPRGRRGHADRRLAGRAADRRRPARDRPDFYAWTAHKAYGPTGIGVLHGRRELLEEMPPFIGGGHMIRTVAANESTWTDLPWKFEAGTSQVAEAIGLGAAVDWIQGLGIDAIRRHEAAWSPMRSSGWKRFPSVDPRPAGGGRTRRADLIRARRGAPARRRRDPRARRGVRPHRSPLRAAADALPRCPRDDPSLVRDPQHRRRLDRLIDGLGEVRRVLQL